MLNLEGIGKEAEIVVNEHGGKQSKSIGRFDLIDPLTLCTFIKSPYIDIVVTRMINRCDNKEMLERLFKQIQEAPVMIAKTLEYGVQRYSKNNWRLIPPEDHMNHALIHLYAHSVGDTQDDHLEHFITRIMMFVATDKNKYNFMEVE